MASHQHHRIVDTQDVDFHAHSLSLWDQHYEQLSAGRFMGRIEELHIGPVQLFREHTQQAVLQCGQPRPGTLTLAVPLATPGQGEAWFCGHPLQPGQCFSVCADGEFELVTRGEFDILAIDVECDALLAYARQTAGLEGQEPDWPTQVLPGRADANAPLQDWLLSTLRVAQEQPHVLQHPAVRQAWVTEACEALLARLRWAAWPDVAQAPGATTAATRQRVVQRARAYMYENAHEAIDVPRLCEVLHVSRRTLQYSFQDVLQMSPVTYLRALRLNGVRRELRASRDESVADCAARWGFWHLSRFASDYRELFGELPSETRQGRRTVVA